MVKNKNLEADYFLKEEEVSRHRLLKKEQAKKNKEDNERLKNLHFMKCPKCGHDLSEKKMNLTTVDQCLNCGVIVLMPQNVDGFIKEEKSFLKSLIDMFK